MGSASSVASWFFSMRWKFGTKIQANLATSAASGGVRRESLLVVGMGCAKRQFNLTPYGGNPILTFTPLTRITSPLKKPKH